MSSRPQTSGRRAARLAAQLAFDPLSHHLGVVAWGLRKREVDWLKDQFHTALADNDAEVYRGLRAAFDKARKEDPSVQSVVTAVHVRPAGTALQVVLNPSFKEALRKRSLSPHRRADRRGSLSGGTVAAVEVAVPAGILLTCDYGDVAASGEKLIIGPVPEFKIPHLSPGEVPRPEDEDGRRSKVERTVDLQRLRSTIGKFDAELTRLHDPVVRQFQGFLEGLERQACPTFEENHELARMVNARADNFGIALQYPDEDGVWRRVRVFCLNTTRSVAGIFNVRTLDKRTLATSAVWPHLRAGRKEDTSD